MSSAISFGDVYLYHLTAMMSLIILGLRGELVELINFDYRKLRPWLLFIAYSLISISWARNTSNALKYNAYLLSGSFLILFLSFFLIKFKLQDLLLRVLGYLFVLHLVLATLEILTPLRWFISEYSTLNEFFLRKAQDFPSFFEKYPTSFFWHQNNCALVTLLGLPFIFRRLEKMKFVLVALAYFVIFMSGSKSIIFLAFLYGCFAITRFITFKNFNLKKIIGPLLLILLLILGVSLFANEEQKNELGQVLSTVSSYVTPAWRFASHEILGTPFNFDEIHINVRERYVFMDGAIKLFKESPFVVLGAGAGSHIGVPISYESHFIFLDSLHNFWLEIFVLYGLGSILFFYGLFLALKNSDTYRHSLVLLIFGIPVLSSAIYFLPMWLLISLAIADKNNSPHNSI